MADVRRSSSQGLHRPAADLAGDQCGRGGLPSLSGVAVVWVQVSLLGSAELRHRASTERDEEVLAPLELGWQEFGCEENVQLWTRDGSQTSAIPRL